MFYKQYNRDKELIVNVSSQGILKYLNEQDMFVKHGCFQSVNKVL